MACVKRWWALGVSTWGWMMLGGAACGGTQAASVTPESETRATAPQPEPELDPEIDEERPKAPPVPPTQVVPGPPTVDPPAANWPSLVNHRVTFRSGSLVDWRGGCTKAQCLRDNPCCNRCRSGNVGFLVYDQGLTVTRGGKQLACRDGNECNAQCEVPTGDVIVTGVLYRYRDHFAIDIEQLEHRIGPCKLLETETRPSELSPTDQCDAKLACDDGKTLEVTCDAENDHSYTSLCQCKVAGVAVTLAEPIIGEAPKSCDYAAKECLRAAGEPGRR